jgi:2-keto-3-deoxy-L-rhamnonate aldolase RhmA
VKPNPLREKLASGKPAFGFYTSFICPDLLEFCGHLNFEWCWLDAEHAALSPDTAVHLVRACETAGVVPTIRVAANNPQHILGYLEIGMMGIQVPHINTADDARKAVDAIRYPPRGRRGAGSTTRAANYGLTQTPSEYFSQANREVVFIALIEEKTGFDNLSEILTVDGIDVVALGPGDLAMSMGLPGQSGHPTVQAMVRRAEEQVVASGKVLDALVANADEARQAVARGARLISIGVSTMLRNAGRSFFDGLST